MSRTAGDARGRGAGNVEGEGRRRGVGPGHRAVAAARAFLVVSSVIAGAGCPPPAGASDPSRCQGTCVTRPGCSLTMEPAAPDPIRPTQPGGPAVTPRDRTVHATAAASDPLPQQLGCGAVYLYRNGAPDGIFVGGHGSFCPDSPATRQVLHDQRKLGYRPGYCESCLGVPPGQVFVFWDMLAGPSCPSGCAPGNASDGPTAF